MTAPLQRAGAPSARARIALVCGAVLATLTLADVALRLRPVRLQHSWLLYPDQPVVLDPDLIYVKTYHLDPAYYRRREGLPNVVALGDSFTAGFPVDPARTYPALLERILDRRGVPMNVINLGTGDSGPDQHLRLFEKAVLQRVRPDVVIWQLYTNDLWDNVEKPVFTIEDGRLVPLSARHNWLYWRQRIFEATPLPASFKRTSGLYTHFLKATEHWMLAQVPESYAKDPTAWALAKMKLEVERMEQLGAENGFRTYYVVPPPQTAYLPEPQPADMANVLKYDGIVREVVRSLPGFIDFRLRSRGATVADRFFVGVERDRNHYGDRHLNEAGYRSLARQIGARIIADRRGRAVH